MIELLDSYTESTASQARDDARKCVVSSIADPNTFLLDHLLTLKPVKLLEGDKIYEVCTSAQNLYTVETSYVTHFLYYMSLYKRRTYKAYIKVIFARGRFTIY